jgi:dephospho-CoA kinase
VTGVLVVGLTGGIGSGKSTVSAAWAGRGAAIVDADLISREILEPGGLAYQPVVERFGKDIVGDDGRIIRPALAAKVFGDPVALADLNALTHPAIGDLIAERVPAAGKERSIVVIDIALPHIIARAQVEIGAMVVVDVPEDVAVERLVAYRGFTEADARARISAQPSREERRAGADLVIDNGGDREELDLQIDKAWQWLLARADGKTG